MSPADREFRVRNRDRLNLLGLIVKRKTRLPTRNRAKTKTRLPTRNRPKTKTRLPTRNRPKTKTRLPTRNPLDRGPGAHGQAAFARDACSLLHLSRVELPAVTQEPRAVGPGLSHVWLTEDHSQPSLQRRLYDHLTAKMA